MDGLAVEFALNLGQTRALFPIELWNMVGRFEEGLGRTNNSIEVINFLIILG